MRRFRGFHETPIARALPTQSLREWNRSKPNLEVADAHLQRILACVPESWREKLERRFAHAMPPVVAVGHDDFHDAPQWAQAWDLLQALADFEDEFGDASAWQMGDEDIRDLSARLAEDVRRSDERMLANNVPLEYRLDDVRRLIRRVGIVEEKPIAGEPAIARAKDPLWWRRRIRTRVARTVEAGNIRMGLVHAGTGGYVSNDALRRRRAQLERNAQALERTLFRNEAGQVYSLADLARLGTANPVIRGGELMTRIRGAEEYADARAHVGMFITLTLPSRFHAVKKGRGSRIQENDKYDKKTNPNPRDGQKWLRAMWAKVRSRLAYHKVKVYGLRVAEPHHDCTPHWHMLMWAEDEAGAQFFERTVRHYWLSDDGDEPGAKKNRVDFKRMVAGGAAGYVAKYVAKSVGHVALKEHLDLVDEHQIRLDFGDENQTQNERQKLGELQEWGSGHHRVDAWASTWGIRQFQTLGMPSVTVWRELRRVSPDQLELFERDDRQTVRAWRACHRHGDIRADWRQFMEAMGGHALPRNRWHLTCARRLLEPGQCNRYGEELKPSQAKVYGVRAQRGRMHGRCLVSRRIAWTPVLQLPDVVEEAQQQIRDREAGVERAALPPAWTGFNNCTARITGGLKYGITSHEAAQWIESERRARQEARCATC